MSRENILSGCLVESDPATSAKARRAKRRALLIAVVLQVLLAGLLVLAPLLGAVEKLSWTTRELVPTVPYKGSPKPRGPTQGQKAKGKKPPLIRNERPIYEPGRIPETVAEINDPPEVFAAQPETSGRGTGIGRPDGIIDLDAPSDRRAVVPKAPQTVAPKPKGPVVVPPTVQEARLVYRVEPKYPPLAQQTYTEGKVVLKAIIGRDGRMESLEVLSGNPLLVQAAREAIAQWRYQPTLLHGEPVEVETLITVVFVLKR